MNETKHKKNRDVIYVNTFNDIDERKFSVKINKHKIDLINFPGFCLLCMLCICSYIVLHIYLNMLREGRYYVLYTCMPVGFSFLI